VGLFKKAAEEKSAIADMKAADAQLDAYGKWARQSGIDHDTPENQQLRANANEAAAKVSFWHGGTKRGR
jgi:hypothetical protein